MSGKKRDLSAEEKSLWRRVASTVKTRRALPPAEPEEAPPAKALRAAVKSQPKPAAAKPAAKLAPLADRGGEKRVRRGQVEIQARLDLHGHTQDSALAALSAFLQRAYAQRARAVLVITGAGRGGEGVLKRRLPDWLDSRALKPMIAGFASAHRTHGGAGAFYVFLKRK